MVQRENVACSSFRSRVVLDEEQMAFLADDGETIATGQDTQELTTIDDLVAFDSYCDEASFASAVLMTKLSTYNSDVLLEDVDNINDLEKEEAQMEDALIPKTIHTTPPDKDYVALATKSILDELIEEFKYEILNVTMVDDEADFNPTKDIDELERLLAKDPQSCFTKIQHNVNKRAKSRSKSNKKKAWKPTVGQFCDSVLEVPFRKHTCFVRNSEGDDLLTGSRGINLYTLSLEDMIKSSPIYLSSKASKTKSWLWHRRLSHLNFDTINELAKQGSIDHGTIHVEFDELTTMAFEQFGSGYKLQLMTPGTISLGLAQNPSPSTPYVPQTKKDWNILFQHMFDKYFQPPSVVTCAASATVALIPVDSTSTPSSTSVDQDAPSVSTSPTTEELQEPVLHKDIKGQETPNAEFDNDLFTNIFNSDPNSEELSLRDVIVSDLQPANQPFEHLSKWTKNHSLDN
nr:retrovirus-related Pol polyprotein from transposon TNT 1-94 [Tanacetum cinerariifolium]